VMRMFGIDSEDSASHDPAVPAVPTLPARL
jgi:hypothetical protein